MKKRIGAILLLSILVLTMIVPGMASACDHSNRKWVVKREATCRVTGWEWLTCKDCGKALAERHTAKKAHKWQSYAYILDPAECKKERKWECTVCHMTATTTSEWNGEPPKPPAHYGQ